jgi:hypothetical protein
MTTYLIDQRVQVFMPDVQRLVPGLVLSATTSCVRVSLDDRMAVVSADPADHFRIHPIEAVTHA